MVIVLRVDRVRVGLRPFGAPVDREENWDSPQSLFCKFSGKTAGNNERSLRGFPPSPFSPTITAGHELHVEKAMSIASPEPIPCGPSMAVLPGVSS